MEQVSYSRRSGRILVPLAFTAAIAWAIHESSGTWQPYVELWTSSPPERLALPVQGVKPGTLADSWGAARDGTRKHQGIDIFAKRGTPVVSPVRGIVIDVGQDQLGGNVVRVLGPGRQVHYFAHLDSFSDVKRRDWVNPGAILGYVGTTGNARGTPPHLHYGIYAAGGAINPFPLLRAAANSSPAPARPSPHRPPPSSPTG